MWRVLVEPVAEHVVGAMGNAMPEEAKAMAGPLIGMLGKAGGAMFGSQVGAALGGLAGEVLTASDIGLPLGPAGKAALLPHNITAFAEGLDVTEDDVLPLPRLREAAAPAAVRARAVAAPAPDRRGRGLRPRRHHRHRPASSRRWASIDPTNPEAIQDALQGGLFEPQQTAEQKAALGRLETTLALVEGWVDDVVGQATAERMPAATKMQEAIRRRRAAGGPAEETFAALVGLELRPRRLRDASTLWGSLRSRQGSEARDAVWAHPDLLPTAADLDDPLGLPRGPRPRWPSSATRTSTRRSASCSTARPAARTTDARGRRRTRRTTGEPARRRARRAHPLAGARPTSRSSSGARVRRAPARAPRRALALVLPRPPHGRRAGAQPRPPHVLLNLHRKARRWFHFGGHLEPGDVTLAGAALREATEESGLAGLIVDAEPLHLSPHPVEFCDPRGTVQHLDVRFLARAGADGRARGQRGVARRALVAGRRPADRRAGHARDDPAGAGRLERVSAGSSGSSSHGARSSAAAWATPSR